MSTRSVNGAVERAVQVLRRGGLVAFPTETVYGLGADAADPEALRRLYAVKRRPADHPVIVHVARAEQLDDVGRDVPEVAHRLARACWPGPLTLVVARDETRVAPEATGGLDTVAVRVPDHPLALALLERFGGGVAAPSANRFGRVSPTTAADVRADLDGDVDEVLDGGPCAVGVESTIVDCTAVEPRVLRLGGVPLERLTELLGHRPPVGGATRAPGTLERHYAPRTRVEVVEAGALEAAASTHEHARVGVLALARDVRSIAGRDHVVVLAAPRDVDEYAHVLYHALRAADDQHLDAVLAVPPPAEGIGAAVCDRLRRAAAGSSG